MDLALSSYSITVFRRAIMVYDCPFFTLINHLFMKVFFKFLCLLLSFGFSNIHGQEKRFSLSAHAGPNGNFFVRSYDEGQIQGGVEFLKKNFIGFVFEGEAKYALNARSWLIGGYMYSNNTRSVSTRQNSSGVNIIVENWTIRHRQNSFYLGYEREISKKLKGLNALMGLYYATYKQEEITITSGNAVFFERNLQNAGFNDAGAFVGLHFERNIDPHVKLGIQSRLYFNVTSAMFEQMTLTPTLTYTFSKKR